MDFVIRPHILSDRDAQELVVPVGSSLAQMVVTFDWPPGALSQVICLVNGEIIPREWWHLVHPKEGSKIMITIRLHGGKKGKTILALVAAIGVAFFAPYAAGLIFEKGTLAFYGMAAGIAIVGNLAISAIFKPPAVSGTANQSAESSTAYNSFTGQSNQARPYGVIPKIYGQHRIYPDLAAAPYTLVEGANQYLYAIYCFGYSPLVIEDIRIGTTPVWNYEDCQISIHDSYLAGQPLDFYKTDIWQDGFSFVFRQYVPIEVTTQADAHSAMVDIVYTKGLGFYNDKGGLEARTAATAVWYKEDGDPDWLPVGNASWFNVSEGKLETQFSGQLKGSIDNQTGYIIFAQGTKAFAARNWANGNFPSVGSYLNLSGYFALVESADAATVNFVDPIPYNIRISQYDKQGWTNVSGWAPSATTWYLTRATASPFPTTIHIGFPSKGKWNIRFMKMDPDIALAQHMNDRSLVALRSVKAGVPPLEPDVPVTIMEVRIKATDQLSGNLDTINALCTSVLYSWVGDILQYRATRNPADIYLDMLRGPALKRVIPDSRIDFSTIKRWFDRNARVDPGFSQPNSMCDFVVDKTYTLWELLNSVASNGRAMPTFKDNKYSVIIDEETKTPVQIFSPRNSWDLKSTKSYLDIPHGLRVKWIDPNSDYKPADGVVYSPGYNQYNATIFEEFQTFGVTRWEQVVRDGRVTLARGMMQQEQFSLQTDIENLVCTRGDLIHVAHDVLQVGGWSARIESIAPQGGNYYLITFDSDLQAFEAPLGVRARNDQGQISDVMPATLISNRILQVYNTILSGLQAGDLVLYGTVDRVSGSYLVKTVRPGNDLTATLEMIEFVPGIYEAERTGVIPPYVPQRGSIVSFNAQPVQYLSFTVFPYFNGRVPLADVVLSWMPPPGAILPKSYIIRRLRDDGTIEEIGRTTDTRFKVLEAVETWQEPYYGAQISYDVLAVWPGVQGPPAEVTVIMPADVVAAPATLTGLSAEVLSRTVRAKWDASPDQYLEFYVIRYCRPGETWESAVSTERKIKANTIDLGAIFATGDWLVMVSQEDRFLLRSEATSAMFTIEAPKQVPVAGNSVGNTAFIRWGTLSGVVSGEWTAQTSFQIEYYEIIKTKIISAFSSYMVFNIPHSVGVIGAQTLERILARESPTTLVGKYSGEFAVLDEQQPGTWRYCVTGVDYAGNRAPPGCIELKLDAPDNYFLLDQIDNLLPETETTEEGVVDTGRPFEWLGPVNTTETWAQHYQNNSWDQPQDQIGAQFPYYAQPGRSTPALVAWEFDYINPLPPLMVTAEASFTVIAVAPILTMILKAKAASGDPWTTVQSQANMVASLLPVNTRFVRIEASIDSGADRKGMLILQNISYRIDVKFKDDSGRGVTDVSGQANVVFNVPFIDVRGVSITSLDPNIAYGRATIASDQRSMMVYTFGPTGLPQGGEFSWIAKGV